MPVGVEYKVYSSAQAPRENECDSLPCGALGNGDVLLSKTSLTLGHDCGGINSLVDFPGTSASAMCVGSRISASFLGEPATPNGAGDCAISYSPVSNVPAGKGYSYGQASMGLRAENPSENSGLARRSCSFENDDSTACMCHGTHMPTSRHNRFLSAVAYGVPSSASALSGSTVSGPLASNLPTLGSTNIDCLVARLEQELRCQCEENKWLRQQVQERDEKLSSLRRMQAAHAQARTQPTMPSDDESMDWFAQLQRAREKLQQSSYPSFGRLSLGGMCNRGDATTASTGFSAPPRPAEPAAGGSSSKDPALLRIDTPPHAHEGLPFTRTLSDELRALPVLADGDGTSVTVAPQLYNSSVPPAVTVVAGGAAAQDKPPGLHLLLVAERRRTDRAHAALLYSSRQASELAQQLAEVQVHAAALHEELRDWRRACLDNHKELVSLRRLTAPAGTEKMIE